MHERLDRIGRRLVTYQEFPFYWVLPGLVAGAAVATALLLIGGCALLMLAAAVRSLSITRRGNGIGLDYNLLPGSASSIV